MFICKDLIVGNDIFTWMDSKERVWQGSGWRCKWHHHNVVPPDLLVSPFLENCEFYEICSKWKIKCVRWLCDTLTLRPWVSNLNQAFRIWITVCFISLGILMLPMAKGWLFGQHPAAAENAGMGACNCGSYIFLNMHTSGRTKSRPMGTSRWAYIREANKHLGINLRIKTIPQRLKWLILTKYVYLSWTVYVYLSWTVLNVRRVPDWCELFMAQGHLNPADNSGYRWMSISTITLVKIH